jgi:ubiquinone/menaquinone biosynthesis C-methylase UbiE
VSGEGQSEVAAYFDHETSFWNDIYDGADVYSVIHQDRRDLALTWIDELRLTPGARVLEIGCGAGLMAVALAHRNLDVDAVDAAPAMVEVARRNASQAGEGSTLRISVGDVHVLDFPDGTFDLAIALGVISWLVAPAAALGEIARVLRPGGTFIGNADNAARLTACWIPCSTHAGDSAHRIQGNAPAARRPVPGAHRRGPRHHALAG